MHPQLEQLDAERDVLAQEASEILERTEYGPTEQARVAEIETELETIKTRREQIETVLDSLQRHGNKATERGADTGPTLVKSTQVSDPWQASPDALSGSELRHAAVAALERSESETRYSTVFDTSARERIMAAAERDDGNGVCEWSLLSSDPAYADAFVSLLRDPVNAHRSWNDKQVEAYGRAHAYAQRAAMSESSTHGSELVPAFLDPSIRLTNTGARSDIRNVAQVVNIGTQTWTGVNSAGVAGEWTSEASEMTDASPTFTNPTITPAKADVYVQASWELMQDSTIGDQLGALFADAKTRLEDAAWATGSGSNQPTGFITTLAVTTASKVAATTNAAFGALDCFALAQSLPARYQQNATWAMNPTTAVEIRKFALASGNVSSAFWTDLGGGTPSTLLGYPVAYSTGMMTSTLSTATASTDYLLTLSDWRQSYVIVDRVGAFVQTNPMVLGSNRRPTGETGVVYWWRTGGKLVNPDGARVLVV